MTPTESLDSYRIAMLPLSQRIRRTADRGVRSGSVPLPTSAAEILCGPQPFPDGIVRAADGRILVTCTTDMPGVSPEMIDWWFGWHLPASERYQLWHPQAHLAATVKEDRSSQAGTRCAYVGNVSYVDEYIGRKLAKLSIAFVPPEVFHIQPHDPAVATSVCAHTGDRKLRARGGGLVHHVVAVPGGAQMRSGFWLGDIRHDIPMLDKLLTRPLNTALMRRMIVQDQLAIDLLIHCGEEMAHLARFLPRLYNNVRAAPG
ncbi:DAPG hydrolase family protein [Burkholderia pseudomallei]|uniref:DAPG hydrolase family protein n=1 Tax=Burkholderia pseudomallei TaxID=28450 RepID=UPI0011783271|nr:hypothetical protein [Burkholderia pseudomallei]